MSDGCGPAPLRSGPRCSDAPGHLVVHARRHQHHERRQAGIRGRTGQQSRSHVKGHCAEQHASMSAKGAQPVHKQLLLGWRNLGDDGSHRLQAHAWFLSPPPLPAHPPPPSARGSAGQARAQHGPRARCPRSGPANLRHRAAVLGAIRHTRAQVLQEHDDFAGVGPATEGDVAPVQDVRHGCRGGRWRALVGALERGHRRGTRRFGGLCQAVAVQPAEEKEKEKQKLQADQLAVPWNALPAPPPLPPTPPPGRRQATSEASRGGSCWLLPDFVGSDDAGIGRRAQWHDAAGE